MEKKQSSRDRVLALLEASRGLFVSGEEIASELGISRTAVWKAVNSLRKDGFMIESVTNRGHCLLQTSDILTEGTIRGYLSGPDLPQDTEIEVFGKVGSTNTVCMQHASSGSHSTYIAVTGCQTQGRGRRGRSFFSPDGTGLYMSILLRPYGLTADQAMRFTTIAAVAVSEAIEEVSGQEALIKWVNDIYVSSRKVCGILTEASFNPEEGTLDYAVVGIGVNVYEPKGGFPEEIRDRAGSVGGSVLENGGRNRLAAEIISRFFRYYADAVRADGQDKGSDHVPAYVGEYRKRCFITGMDVDVIKAGAEPRRARALEVDNECRLRVRYETGYEEVLSSGEISIRL